MLRRENYYAVKKQEQMAARFVLASDDVINNLKTSSENKNTRKSTNLWVGIFKKWAALRNFEENLETYDVRELDNVLSKFYAEVRKENGDEYEPDSLKVMQASIDRFLREKGYPKSILRDNEFLNSKKVLEGKARNLRRDGLGKQPNKAPYRRRENIVGKRSPGRRKPSTFGEHDVVASYSTFWVTRSTRAS